MSKTKITRLYEIRKALNLTQEQASQLFGVSKSYYCQIESGNCKAGRPFIEVFIKLFPYESPSIFFEQVG